MDAVPADPQPDGGPGIALDNSLVPRFLASSCCVFAATGIGNGSAYKMIPAIWRNEARRTAPGSPERAAALAIATKESSAALGIVGAVGASAAS